MLVNVVNSGFKLVKRVFVLLILFLLITILLFFGLKKQFMPIVDRGKFTLNITFKPGIPIEDNRRLLYEIIEEIKKHKDVENVYTNIGYEEDDPFVLLQEEVGVHVSKLIVLLKKKRRKSVFKIVNELTNSIKYREDLKIVYEIPSNVITEILNVKKYDFSFDVGSDDRTIIDRSAFDLFNRLDQSKLFKEIEISKKTGKPQIRIYFDYDSLSGTGVNSKGIYELLNTAIKGTKVADYKIDDDLIDITLRLREQDREDIKDLERYKLSIKDMKIPISYFIKLQKQNSPSKILRKNQNEVIKLYGNFLKNNKKSKIQTDNIISNFLKDSKNVFISEQDEVVEMNESFKNLFFAFLFSLFLVYALLASQFESFLKPVIIMTCVPFSFLGSLLFLFITGNSININSIMGIIMLSGIVVNNSIILFDKYSKNINIKNMTLENSILSGTKDRIKPVLMTSFTTICGLIPMAIGIGRGGKLQSSLAISVLGGLLLSTFITFFILPNLYYLIEKKKKK
jgi:HAE1 family hydrophobic/amphiphilic exporter-1